MNILKLISKFRDSVYNYADAYKNQFKDSPSFHNAACEKDNCEKKLIAAVEKLDQERRIYLRERDEARAWVKKLISETQTLTCVYCGHAYPPGTPAHGTEELTKHIMECSKHPIKGLQQENKELRSWIDAFREDLMRVIDSRVLR